jgi:hypothetical protein
MASTGFNAAAFFAGRYPAITPTKRLIPTSRIKLYRDKVIGKLRK